MMTGGYQVPGQGTGDDGFEEEGYDESQRAEILEVTGDGPTDGLIITDLTPDIADDDDDDLEMEDDELGDDDDEDESDEDDDDEDDVQDDLDADEIDEDSLSDADDVALRP